MDKPKRGAPDQRELEEAIRELEEHLARLRSLLEEARADEADDSTDWSVFDAEPRDRRDKEG